MILDSLKQNSKLLHLYNRVATDLFAFCLKFKCQREYKKLADTLFNHYQHLEKAKKNPDQFMNSKIPYPVRLDDPECQVFLLELRKVQIEYAIKMDQWSDAYRSSEIIYKLIEQQKKKPARSDLLTFFKQLSMIFFASGNYLFHSYALMNRHNLLQKSADFDDSERAQL